MLNTYKLHLNNGRLRVVEADAFMLVSDGWFVFYRSNQQGIKREFLRVKEDQFTMMETVYNLKEFPDA